MWLFWEWYTHLKSSDGGVFIAEWLQEKIHTKLLYKMQALACLATSLLPTVTDNVTSKDKVHIN